MEETDRMSTHYIQTEVPYQETLALMRDFHHHYGGLVHITRMSVVINGNQFKFLPVNYPKSKLRGIKITPYKEFYDKYYNRHAKNTNSIMKVK